MTTSSTGATTSQFHDISSVSGSASFASNGEAALRWFNFGFKVIPITPGTKIPAVAWNGWFSSLSSEKISTYWTAHPDYDIAFLVGEETLVLDADTSDAVSTLRTIEREYRAAPLMVVQTTRGEHHYFRLPPEVYARTDSHSTANHPERIDVKTGRTLVILPPSTGKVLECCHPASAKGLHDVDQDFVDAVFQHNGRPLPRRAEIAATSTDDVEPIKCDLRQLESLLAHILPDCGYEDWRNVLMALHHETGGSEDGFKLADSWSSGGKGYKGTAEIRTKWRSFQGYTGKPITIGSLIKMAQENGANVAAILGDEPFGICEEMEIVLPNDPVVGHANSAKLDTPQTIHRANPLDKFSLLGKSAELEKNAVEEVHVMGEIVLKGQATAIYAAPNTGKTVLAFRLLTEAIHSGRINPAKLYYLNMDDTGSGLREKVRLAEEYGFHVLAEGHADFQISAFLGMVNEMIKNDQCKDVIIVLDTLKKFTNLMDKGISSGFAKVIRRFVLKGGTLIALAHTNKNPGRNGKPIHSGTSDIVDDFDCAYTLAMISIDQSTKVVEFENFKRRGNVAATAAYSYSVERGISYSEILLSVQAVDSQRLEPIKQAEAIKSDGEVIAAVAACINDGINTKMKLAEAVADRTGISRKSALNIIERYTGDDPAHHRWNFDVRGRGAKVYACLQPAATGEVAQ